MYQLLYTKATIVVSQIFNDRLVSKIVDKIGYAKCLQIDLIAAEEFKTYLSERKLDKQHNEIANIQQYEIYRTSHSTIIGYNRYIDCQFGYELFFSTVNPPL